jgi:hypothetical protein
LIAKVLERTSGAGYVTLSFLLAVSAEDIAIVGLKVVRRDVYMIYHVSLSLRPSNAEDPP